MLALALGLLSPFVVAAAPALGSASVSLALSPPEVTYGEKQQASGVVTADAPCAAGRTVDLQQKPPGGTQHPTGDADQVANEFVSTDGPLCGGVEGDLRNSIGIDSQRGGPCSAGDAHKVRRVNNPECPGVFCPRSERVQRPILGWFDSGPVPAARQTVWVGPQWCVVVSPAVGDEIRH